MNHGKPFVIRWRSRLRARARSRRRGRRRAARRTRRGRRRRRVGVRCLLGFLRLLRGRIYDGGVVLDLLLRRG